MSGYLMFNESSGGTLILHWSEEPIEGAIAMFTCSVRVTGGTLTKVWALLEHFC